MIWKYEDFVSLTLGALWSRLLGLEDYNCFQTPYLTDRWLKELHLFALINERTFTLTDLVLCSIDISFRQFLVLVEEIFSSH